MRAVITLVLSALALAATGCGGEEQPQTLEEWAASVCAAFDDAGSASNAELRDLGSKYRALARDLYLDHSPGRVSPSLLDSLSRDRLLAVVRGYLDAIQRLESKLEVLEAPDSDAGREGRKLLSHAIANNRDADRYTRELEAKVGQLPDDASPTQVVEMTNEVLLGYTHTVAAATFMAPNIGHAKRQYPALTQAFKDADACKPLAKAIAVGEGVLP